MHRVVLFINPKPAAGHAQTRRGQTGNAKPVLCLVPSHGKGVEELPKNLLILSREPTQCSFSSLDIKVLKHWQYDCHTLDPLPEKPFWSLTPLSRCCNHFCHCNHCGHDCHNRPQCHTSDIVAIQAWSFEFPNSAHLLLFWRQTRKQQNEHCLKI